jgi:prefoldin subunit 5
VDDSFELLEQRVQKAAARLQALTAENATLRAELEKAVARGDEAVREAHAATDGGAIAAKEGARVETIERELLELRRERDLVRSRIAKLVTLLDTLD